MQLTDVIHELLDKKKMSQLDLAEATGLTPSTISRIVTGKAIPRQGNLRKLANVLCDTEEDRDLLYGCASEVIHSDRRKPVIRITIEIKIGK